MQYVGQTNQQVSKRMNSHRFDINNFDSQGYASNIALHINSYPHSIADFSFLPIDVVKDEMTRLCKETYWIHKLDTLHPKGMNSKLCTMFSSSLATFVCSYYYFFVYMHFIRIVVSNTFQ